MLEREGHTPPPELPPEHRPERAERVDVGLAVVEEGLRLARLPRPAAERERPHRVFLLDVEARQAEVPQGAE